MRINLRQSALRVWLRYTGAVCLPPRKVKGGLRVLTYHRVRPDADDPRSVTPQRFREHLQLLRTHWRVVSLSEVLQAIEGNKPLPDRAVLLTFDDGYADLYEYALPLLQEFCCPAVVFMLARYVGKRGRTYSEAHYPEARFLSATQLREMRQVGIEIGSHGLWHVPLVSLTPQRAWEEISESKALLSDLLGEEVRAFSYPWGRAGDFSDEHVTMVAKAGYQIAFTMLHGINVPPFQRLTLRRCHVYPWDKKRTFLAILEGRFDGWCLKNSPLWNHRRQLLRQWLGKFPMSETVGKRF